MSVVLRLALKPHWLSERCSSAIAGTSLFSNTLLRICRRWREWLSHDNWSSQTFPFVLVQNDDYCVTEISWEVSLLPAAAEEFEEFYIEGWSSIFPNMWCHAINSCRFSTLQLFYGFRRLLQYWGLVQFGFYWLLWKWHDLGCVPGMEFQIHGVREARNGRVFEDVLQLPTYNQEIGKSTWDWKTTRLINSVYLANRYSLPVWYGCFLKQ